MKLNPLTSSILSAVILFLSAGFAQGAIERYEIDTAHSSITFKVRHFFSKVPGSFTNFSGQIFYDTENPENSYAEANIKASSIDTNNAKRDRHLNNEDFLDTPNYPRISFRSTSWKPLGDNKFEVTGNLSVLKTTLPLTLDVEFLGKGKGFGGSYIAGWSGKTEINRSDFGITHGKPAVGDKVEIEINVESKLIGM